VKESTESTGVCYEGNKVNGTRKV